MHHYHLWRNPPAIAEPSFILFMWEARVVVRHVVRGRAGFGRQAWVAEAV